MDMPLIGSILICLGSGVLLGLGLPSSAEVKQRGWSLGWLPFSAADSSGLLANLLANAAVFLGLPILACVLARREFGWFEFVGLAWLVGAGIGKMLRLLAWRSRA